MPVIVGAFETRKPDANPKVTTVVRFATGTPRSLRLLTLLRCEDAMPVLRLLTLLGTRRPNASPKAMTGQRLATGTPTTVDPFETRKPDTNPKVKTVLRFATRTPLIPETVAIFETRRRHASPKVTTVLRFETRTPRSLRLLPLLSPKATTILRFRAIFGRGRLRTHGGRLRTLRSSPNPQTHNLKSRRCAFGKNHALACPRTGYLARRAKLVGGLMCTLRREHPVRKPSSRGPSAATSHPASRNGGWEHQNL